MNSWLGPPRFNQIVTDVLCVANQMIALAIILNLVIATEPRGGDVRSQRRVSCRSIHPSQYDFGGELTDCAFHAVGAGNVEHTAQTQLKRCNASSAQRSGAVCVAANNDFLLDANARQGRCQTGEEGFSATMFGTSHDLHQLGHDSSPFCEGASSRAFKWDNIGYSPANNAIRNP